MQVTLDRKTYLKNVKRAAFFNPAAMAPEETRMISSPLLRSLQTSVARSSIKFKFNPFLRVSTPLPILTTARFTFFRYVFRSSFTCIPVEEAYV